MLARGQTRIFTLKPPEEPSCSTSLVAAFLGVFLRRKKKKEVAALKAPQFTATICSSLEKKPFVLRDETATFPPSSTRSRLWVLLQRRPGRGEQLLLASFTDWPVWKSSLHPGRPQHCLRSRPRWDPRRLLPEASREVAAPQTIRSSHLPLGAQHLRAAFCPAFCFCCCCCCRCWTSCWGTRRSNKVQQDLEGRSSKLEQDVSWMISIS